MSLRDRINSDRKLQAGLGLILVLVVFLLLHKGGGEEAEAVAEEPTAASVETGETTLGIEGTLGAEGEASLAALSESVKAPPLPRKVTAAYEANETVAVLFTRRGSTEDKWVSRYSKLLRRRAPKAGRPDRLRFKLFVVPTKKIGRYSALTLGLQIQRVPALVILRRKSLTKGGPEASVLYGYQSPVRIYLALRDASYKGPSGSYHPG